MEQEDVDQRITYDPTIGFTMKETEIPDSGIYTCQVDDLKHESSTTMVLLVTRRK